MRKFKVFCLSIVLMLLLVPATAFSNGRVTAAAPNDLDSIHRLVDELVVLSNQLKESPTRSSELSSREQSIHIQAGKSPSAEARRIVQEIQIIGFRILSVAKIAEFGVISFLEVAAFVIVIYQLVRGSQASSKKLEHRRRAHYEGLGIIYPDRLKQEVSDRG